MQRCKPKKWHLSRLSYYQNWVHFIQFVMEEIVHPLNYRNDINNNNQKKKHQLSRLSNYQKWGNFLSHSSAYCVYWKIISWFQRNKHFNPCASAVQFCFHPPVNGRTDCHPDNIIEWKGLWKYFRIFLGQMLFEKQTMYTLSKFWTKYRAQTNYALLNSAGKTFQERKC